MQQEQKGHQPTIPPSRTDFPAESALLVDSCLPGYTTLISVLAPSSAAHCGSAPSAVQPNTFHRRVVTLALPVRGVGYMVIEREGLAPSHFPGGAGRPSSPRVVLSTGTTICFLAGEDSPTAVHDPPLGNSCAHGEEARALFRAPACPLSAKAADSRRRRGIEEPGRGRRGTRDGNPCSAPTISRERAEKEMI